MKRKAILTRSSHRMIASAGRRNNAILSSADSLGPCCKHFFVCRNETNTITDIKGGLVLSDATTDVSISPGGAPNTMRLLSWPLTGGGQLLSGEWYPPHDKDVLIISCGKVTGDSNGKGHLSFYTGLNGVNGQLKVQPYYAVFSAALDLPEDNYPYEHQSIATPFNPELAELTIGNDYICAAGKNGNLLTHWKADETETAILTGTNDITKAVPELQSAWNDYIPTERLYVGHGVSGPNAEIATCQPDCTLSTSGGICDCNYDARITQANGDKEVPGTFSNAAANAEVAQDYYFLAKYVFEDGMPSDEEVSDALTTMKAQAVAGQEVGYIPWLLLR